MDAFHSVGAVAGIAAGASVFLAILLTTLIVLALRWRHQRLLAKQNAKCDGAGDKPCLRHFENTEKSMDMHKTDNSRVTCRCSTIPTVPYTPQKSRSYQESKVAESPQVSVKIPSPDLELSPDKEGWPLPPRLTPSHKRLRSTPARSFRTNSSGVSPFTLPKLPPRAGQSQTNIPETSNTGFRPSPLFHARGPSIDQEKKKTQRERAASTPNLPRPKTAESTAPTIKSVERPRPSRSSSVWSQDPGIVPDRPVPPLPIMSTPKHVAPAKVPSEAGSRTVSDVFSDHSSVLGGSRTFSPANTDNTSVTMSSPPTIVEDTERATESDQSNGMKFDIICHSLKSFGDNSLQSTAQRKNSESTQPTPSENRAHQCTSSDDSQSKRATEISHFQAFVSGNPFTTDSSSSSSSKGNPPSRKSHKSQKSVSFTDTPRHHPKTPISSSKSTKVSDQKPPVPLHCPTPHTTPRKGEPIYYHLPSAREFQFELVAPPDGASNPSTKPNGTQPSVPSSPSPSPPSTPSRKPHHPHRERDILSWDGSPLAHPLHLPKKSSTSVFRLSTDLQSQASASSRRSSTSISKFPDPPNLPHRHPSHTLRTAVLNSHVRKSSQLNDGDRGVEGESGVGKVRGPRVQPPRIKARSSSKRHSRTGSTSPTKDVIGMGVGVGRHHKHSRSKNSSASLKVAQALRRMNSEVSEGDGFCRIGGEEGGKEEAGKGSLRADLFEGLGKGENPSPGIGRDRERGEKTRSRFVEELEVNGKVDVWDGFTTAVRGA